MGQGRKMWSRRSRSFHGTWPFWKSWTLDLGLFNEQWICSINRWCKPFPSGWFIFVLPTLYNFQWFSMILYWLSWLLSGLVWILNIFFKVNTAGNPGFYHLKWAFSAKFPMNQWWEIGWIWLDKFDAIRIGYTVSSWPYVGKKRCCWSFSHTGS